MAGIAFVVCTNLLNVITPLITRDAVDLIANNLQKISANHPMLQIMEQTVTKDVLWLFLKYLAVALAAGAFMFLMRQNIIVVSRLIEYDLKNEMYNHYQELHLAFYRENNTGDLMNRITEDVSRVRMYAGPAIMYAVNLMFTILFAVISMSMLNPTLTLWVIIPLPILSVIIYYVNQWVEKTTTEIQAQLSNLTTQAQETYSGIMVVQAYARETNMLQHFSAESEVYRQKQLKLARIDSVYFPVMSFLVGCSIIITVFVGGIQVSQGKLSVGSLAAFIMYTNMLMWPVSSLGWVASMIQKAIASQRRINDFLDIKPAIPVSGGEKPAIKGNIQFKNVSFTYPNTGITAVKNISFHIKPGERIAIIGRTGSGKSTIAELLTRMYDIQNGVIEIDGYDIRSINAGYLRSQIGFVPQDVFLFSETIADNIAIGKPNTHIDTVRQFAKYAVIDEEIAHFPLGYHTMVGERGVTLSGGQKQRISIARALIKQPAILLLDDSLSAVDTVTEKQIQHNLSTLLADKTAIIITHRIFSLIQFDKILVLDNGEIVEQGTHDELLQKKGVYAVMFENQLKEQRNQQVINEV